MKKQLKSWQLLLIGILCLLLQGVPKYIFGYMVGSALGVAVNIGGLVALVLGIVRLIKEVVGKVKKPKTKE